MIKCSRRPCRYEFEPLFAHPRLPRPHIARIKNYTHGITETAFLGDEKTQDAVIRNIEVIGEAARNIERNHPDFAAQHADVPWGIAYEMRNALAHGYFKVDF